MSAMNWLLSDIAIALGATVQGPAAVTVQRIVTDSRLLQAGDLFVALSGERVDGHDFIVQAIAQGAVALLLARPLSESVGVAYIVVEDTQWALQRLAQAWRQRQQLTSCTLVTGSNGKTSVKEMIRVGLMAHYGQSAVLATQGNLNNHLGLPMTLLSLRDAHQSAVVEVGANHVGEIAQLAPLAQPTTAVVTSIAPAHIGEFGSLAAIKQAKGEIWQSLPSSGGVAVVPIVAIDSEFDAWSSWQTALAAHRVIAFGSQADLSENRGWQDWVMVTQRQVHGSVQQVQLQTSQWGSAAITLPLLGAHQANNFAAAVAVLLAEGVNWQTIQQGMHHLQLPGGRLKLTQPLPNLLLIDDSYNANVRSMQAAIDVLMEQPAQCHVLVMGEMGELGDASLVLHQQVVDYARQRGVDVLLVSGQFSQTLLSSFGVGVADNQPERLAAELWTLYQQQPSLAVLVKGSRSARMERVIDAFMTRYVTQE